MKTGECGCGVEQSSPIEVEHEAGFARQLLRILQVIWRQDPPIEGVLQGKQAGTGKVGIVRLDRRPHPIERQATVRVILDGLGLDRPQHGHAPALPSIGVRHLPDQNLVTASAETHDPNQIALRATGGEEGAIEAEHGRSLFLKRVDGGVVAEDVVAYRSLEHGFPHGPARPGHRVAAKIGHFPFPPVIPSAILIAAIMLLGSARSFPAISNAVP